MFIQTIFWHSSNTRLECQKVNVECYKPNQNETNMYVPSKRLNLYPFETVRIRIHENVCIHTHENGHMQMFNLVEATTEINFSCVLKV
jgi:hypothetical protein